jgi:hypothetical protein
MEMIVQQALQHHVQVAKLAPVLQSDTLEKTCHSIHDFLYWHLH